MTTTRNTNEITIRRSEDRGATQIGWLDSRHSFSFGGYYDPKNMGYRALRVINDDYIAPGMGFGEHGHDNMEIITWMLEGSLRHGDSMGHLENLSPGEAQVMSAGSGLRHSEFNASKDARAHLLQVWIEPSVRNIEPRYGQRVFDAADRADRFQAIASGRGTQDALPIHQDADVLIADVSAGGEVTYDLADGRHAYVHIATGKVTLNGAELSAGDAATIESAGKLNIVGSEASQVMLFDLA
jgi:hypothetical protein